MADVWQTGMPQTGWLWPSAMRMTRPSDAPVGAATGQGPAPARAATFGADSADAVLVALSIAGERRAFDLIVERHQRAVYQVCYRFAGSHADASDLVQDVFVRAYRALPGFKGDAALGTWLYRIAVNVGLNHVSSRKAPMESLETADHIDTRDERPDASLLRSQRARIVRGAIARLPPKQRATLVLRVYRELPHEEIARILGSSVGAAKANLFHALHNLRRLLRDESLR